MAAIASTAHTTFTANTSEPLREADPDPTQAHSYRALAHDLGMHDAALEPEDLGSVMDDLAQLLQQVTLSAREFHGHTSVPEGTATGGIFHAA